MKPNREIKDEMPGVIGLSSKTSFKRLSQTEKLY